MKSKVNQIIDDVEEAVKTGVMKIGSRLPSLTQIQWKYQVSRDTANRAYRDLLQRGVIWSARGKGYYISGTGVMKMNVFMLLDELSEYKNILVRSIQKSLGDSVESKLYFHHYNEEVFHNLISQNLGKFTHYAISPFPGSKVVQRAIELIPAHQLLLIDRHDEQSGQHPFVGQEFEDDVFDCLTELQESILAYEQFIFLFPEPSHHPAELIAGFERFCSENSMSYQVMSRFSADAVKAQTLFLILDDRDLASIVMEARIRGFEIGTELGIISYNETPLKAVVSNGITTISADFDQLGQSIVRKLKDNSLPNIRSKAKVHKRNSL